jgi:hypothetical protein
MAAVLSDTLTLTAVHGGPLLQSSGFVVLATVPLASVLEL